MIVVDETNSDDDKKDEDDIKANNDKIIDDRAVRGDYNLTSTPYYFDVIVGSTHRLGMSHLGTPYRIRISEIHLHPHLKKLAFDAVDWDFALLKLSVPVDYTDYIQPVCLPHLGQSVSLTSLCYLAGWGLMNPQQGKVFVDVVIIVMVVIKSSSVSSLSWQCLSLFLT